MKTFTKIAQVVAGGLVDKLEVTNIPSNYHAWYIRMVLRNNAGLTNLDNAAMRFNNNGNAGAYDWGLISYNADNNIQITAPSPEEQFGVFRSYFAGSNANDWQQLEGYLYRPSTRQASFSFIGGAYGDSLYYIAGAVGMAGLGYNGPITSLQLFTNYRWVAGSKIEIYGIE